MTEHTSVELCAVHQSPLKPLRFPRAAGAQSYCEQCSEDAERARRAAAESEQRQDRQRVLVHHSGLVGRQLQASFNSFTAASPAQEKVLAACQTFVQNFTPDQGAGLWLVGPPGTGKTHLGSAMVQGVIYGYTLPAKILSAREIVRRLRDTWRRGAPETETAVIDDLAGAALLVLDEVGVGFGTEGEQVQLFDVLDERYKLQAATVLLSNLSVPDLRTALGERLFDRLREGARVLMCDWASHRAGAARA